MARIQTVGFGYDPEDTLQYTVVLDGKTAQFVEILGRRRVKAELTWATWRLLADPLKADFNTRLKDRNLKAGRWNQCGQTLLDKLLGKEAILLAWAVEGATEPQIEFAIRNWEGLRPEERWWLYTTANATYNLPTFGPDRGWRRALRIALTDDPRNPAGVL